MGVWFFAKAQSKVMRNELAERVKQVWLRVKIESLMASLVVQMT